MGGRKELGHPLILPELTECAVKSSKALSGFCSSSPSRPGPCVVETHDRPFKLMALVRVPLLALVGQLNYLPQ